MIYVFLATSAVAEAAGNKVSFQVTGLYERARLSRSSDAGPNFSVNSDAGYRAQLNINFYLSQSVLLDLGGEYIGYDYVGSASRSIIGGQDSSGAGSLGFIFQRGDFSTFIRGVYKPVFILTDIALTEHELKSTHGTFGYLGFRLHAASQFYDLNLELSGGAPAADIEYENLPVKYLYSAGGAIEIVFGKSKGPGALFGVRLQMVDDSYKYDDKQYSQSNLSAGLYFKYTF